MAQSALTISLIQSRFFSMILISIAILIDSREPYGVPIGKITILIFVCIWCFYFVRLIFVQKSDKHLYDIKSNQNEKQMLGQKMKIVRSRNVKRHVVPRRIV